MRSRLKQPPSEVEVSDQTQPVFPCSYWVVQQVCGADYRDVGTIQLVSAREAVVLPTPSVQQAWQNRSGAA
jgi:hypothetical protein